MGRYIGNDILVWNKFGEHLTGYADVNAERNPLRRRVETIISHLNH